MILHAWLTDYNSFHFEGASISAINGGASGSKLYTLIGPGFDNLLLKVDRHISEIESLSIEVKLISWLKPHTFVPSAIHYVCVKAFDNNDYDVFVMTKLEGRRINIMAIIFLTGLSGVGKTSILKQLEKEGYNIIDTDYGYTETIGDDFCAETVWDEEKINHLLLEHSHSHLFISGCYSNQGKFYAHFDKIVLLKCELEVMLDRVRNRTSNSYGKHSVEYDEIIESYKNVLPLLETRADIMIDTTNISVDAVCSKIKTLIISEL